MIQKVLKAGLPFIRDEQGKGNVLYEILRQSEMGNRRKS